MTYCLEEPMFVGLLYLITHFRDDRKSFDKFQLSFSCDFVDSQVGYQKVKSNLVILILSLS